MAVRMDDIIDRRPMELGDEEFLFLVYASTRAEELAAVPWDAAQKEAFLRMQFRAQHTHYLSHYPEASYAVLFLAGQPAGRLYLDRRDEELRILDIALLPEHRNRGIGTALIREVMDEAASAGKPVRLHVESFNPAYRLYTRLGFTPISDTGVYTLMEWRPA